MKAIILRVTMITALAMAFTAVSVQAQTFINKQNFTVPFEFKIGNKVLPAGEYSVFVENQTIRLRKSDGNANAIALSQRTVLESKTKSDVKLTFRRYGDQVYLSQVWLADGIGRELKRPRRENTDLAQKFTIVEVPGSIR